MVEYKYVTNNLTSMDPQTGDISLKVEFEGESKIPFWNDDLKVKVILSLLDSIDIKNYSDCRMTEQAHEDAEEIIKSTRAAFGMDY